MTTEWTGVILEVSAKDWNGTDLYSFKIEGEDRWFRTGTSPIPFEAGANVKFEERNTKVLVESMELSSAGPGAVTKPLAEETLPDHCHRPPGAPPSTVRSASVSVEPAQYVGEVGKRLQWQSARRDAVAIVTAALALEATNVESKGVLPWAANIAKAKKLDLLIGYINQLAEGFIEQESKL
jgi:hypothetical protein